VPWPCGLLHFASLKLSDVLISVGPRAGAVATLFAFLPISDVLISVDVLEAALAFGVEGADEQAQEHRYHTKEIRSERLIMMQQKVTCAAFVMKVTAAHLWVPWPLAKCIVTYKRYKIHTK
jgi:hypothetical protein